MMKIQEPDDIPLLWLDDLRYDFPPRALSFGDNSNPGLVDIPIAHTSPARISVTVPTKCKPDPVNYDPIDRGPIVKKEEDSEEEVIISKTLMAISFPQRPLARTSISPPADRKPNLSPAAYDSLDAVPNIKTEEDEEDKYIVDIPQSPSPLSSQYPIWDLPPKPRGAGRNWRRNQKRIMKMSLRGIRRESEVQRLRRRAVKEQETITKVEVEPGQWKREGESRPQVLR